MPISLINLEYAKNLVYNETKILDKKELLVVTYKESFPLSAWQDLDDIQIYNLSLKKKTNATRAITRFRIAVQDISHVTVASIIDELDEAREMAKDQQNPASMIQATMSKAKTAGLIVNKVENKNSTYINIEAEIKTVPQDFIKRLEQSGAVLPSRPIIDVTQTKDIL